MSIIIGLTNGSFVVKYLSAIRSSPFVESRPFPAILPVLLQGLFRAGVGAFVGCLAIEPGFRNEYSFGYLVPIGDFYIVADISICLDLL